MKIGVPKEVVQSERRVAATPDTVQRLVDKGLEVLVQAGAGVYAHFTDDVYRQAGAQVIDSAQELYGQADVVLKVQPPEEWEVEWFKPESNLVSLLRPYENQGRIEALNQRKVSCFSLELIPRISRAQSMDVLSSQANLAGYKAVLMAAERYNAVFPMLMTAAGTVRPARLLVLGVGVAGLQAIATAKRLGAVVLAYDIRSAAKEQVQSLGARFVELDVGIENGEGSGGYARELTEEERRLQQEKLSEIMKQQDIIITTAAVPGRPAPKLISAETVRGMSPGSVIIDLAAESGGNCELTQPGEEIMEGDVLIVGKQNIPSLLATESSRLISRNILNFVQILLDENGNLAVDTNDEIVAASLLAHEGTLVHPLFAKTTDEQSSET